MKKLILILLLISVFTITAFGLSGTYTTNEFFYMPGYGSYGSLEFAEYNKYMEIADNAIKANETAVAAITEDVVEAYIFDSDAETITGNWVNTANPWADNEVSDTLTASNLVAGSSVVSDSEVDNDITVDLATLATTFTCTDNESEDLACPIVFVDGATGTQGGETDGDLYYNPSTGTLTATIFDGSGQADFASVILDTALSAAEGGTGVANNAANTLTFTGNYSLGLTLTANTAVTMPESGTLATLAGTETLTNKTVTSPTIYSRVTSKTTTATLNVAESGLVTVTAASAYTILLPTAVGNGGLIYIIKKTDDNSNRITIDGNADETIDGAATYTDLNYQYSYVIIISDNSNWLIIGESTVKGGTF